MTRKRVLIGGPLHGCPAPDDGPDVLEIAHDGRSPLDFAADAATGRPLLNEPELVIHRYILRTWEQEGPHPCIAGLTITLAAEMYVHESLPGDVDPGQVVAEHCVITAC